MSENLLLSQSTFDLAFQNAVGLIDYGFTNDYMFRALLQQNNHVLKALICSLLHLKADDATSVEITNPILPGEAIDMKEFILDIHVTLNSNTFINLEMQVINRMNWPERSLSYLCRRFDQLAKGQNYIQCKPVIHIGFLDFTPFPEYPEFYATYMMQNIKNHNLYSDKFILRVVDLTHIELATEEDQAYEIEHWARLFKASTWEELKMIANNSQILTDASKALYQLNADEIMRQRCRAREDFLQYESAMKKISQTLKAEIDTTKAELDTANTEIEILDTKVHTLTAENDALLAEREQLLAKLAEYEAKENRG